MHQKEANEISPKVSTSLLSDTQAEPDLTCQGK